MSALWFSTSSRSLAESPAMLPRAHTACSRTLSLGELSSWINMGTAPFSTHSLVCSEVPDVMLVNAQLQRRAMPLGEELDEALNDAGVDDLLDRRVLNGQKLAELTRRFLLHLLARVVERLHDLRACQQFGYLFSRTKVR